MGSALRVLVGLSVLIGIAYLGGWRRTTLHLTLPGPVIGLALFAAICLLAARFSERTHRQLTIHLAPVSRLLVSHLGLLFVPAGVGIIMEGDMLRREWLPLIAGVIGSTVLGLAVTGRLMHAFAKKGQGR